MEKPVDILLLFYVYSLLGWCIEVTLKYFEFHRFINRGFLTGPWLPIYGSGAVLITLSVKALSVIDSGYAATFLTSFFLCGALEYSASYCMERLFHARWWDYTRRPMNLHGRIWIGNLILFGLGGLVIVHLVNPLLSTLFAALGGTLKLVLAWVLSVLFLADFVISQFVLKLVKNGIEHSEADNTEEIGKEIRRLLSNRSIFYRRFADAYPDAIFLTERVKARLEDVRQETERLRREAELRVSNAKQRLAEGKEKLLPHKK